MPPTFLNAVSSMIAKYFEVWEINFNITHEISKCLTWSFHNNEIRIQIQVHMATPLLQPQACDQLSPLPMPPKHYCCFSVTNLHILDLIRRNSRPNCRAPTAPIYRQNNSAHHESPHLKAFPFQYFKSCKIFNNAYKIPLCTQYIAGREMQESDVSHTVKKYSKGQLHRTWYHSSVSHSSTQLSCSIKSICFSSLRTCISQQWLNTCVCRCSFFL